MSGLMLALLLGAHRPGVPFDPARLRVEPPGTVDLGSLGPLERKDVGYLIRNASGRPIGFALLDLPGGVQVEGPALQGPIAPASAAALTLHLDPSGLQGPQRRVVRFHTDDPRQGTYYLPILFKVRPDLTVDAPRCDFGSVGSQESPQRTFTFKRETGGPVALRLVTQPPPHLDAEILAGGATARLLLTLRPSRLEPGVKLGMEHLRLETNVPLQPAFDLYVSWKVHDPVNAEPSRGIFLDPSVRTLDLRLSSWDGRPFLLEGAQVEGGGFEAEWDRGREAPVQTLRVRRSALSTTRSRLVLRFRGEDRPLVVPLAYLPGPGPADQTP
jgi:hypothetical protein